MVHGKLRKNSGYKMVGINYKIDLLNPSNNAYPFWVGFLFSLFIHFAVYLQKWGRVFEEGGADLALDCLTSLNFMSWIKLKFKKGEKLKMMSIFDTYMLS